MSNIISKSNFIIHKNDIFIIGNNNKVNGNNNIVYGNNNVTNGKNNIMYGNNNIANGKKSTSDENDKKVTIEDDFTTNFFGNSKSQQKRGEINCPNITMYGDNISGDNITICHDISTDLFGNNKPKQKRSSNINIPLFGSSYCFPNGGTTINGLIRIHKPSIEPIKFNNQDIQNSNQPINLPPIKATNEEKKEGKKITFPNMKNESIVEDSYSGSLCIICLEKKPSTVFIPCGHVQMCIACVHIYGKKSQYENIICSCCQKPVIYVTELFEN